MTSAYNAGGSVGKTTLGDGTFNLPGTSQYSIRGNVLKSLVTTSLTSITGTGRIYRITSTSYIDTLPRIFFPTGTMVFNSFATPTYFLSDSMTVGGSTWDWDNSNLNLNGKQVRGVQAFAFNTIPTLTCGAATLYIKSTDFSSVTNALLNSSQWSVAGNIKLAGTVTEGTSSFTTTAASNITTNGKRFYDLTFNGGATNKDSTVDSCYVTHNFTITSSRAKMGGHSWRVGNNMTWGGADSMYARQTGSKLFLDGGTFQITNTMTQAGRMTDSLTVICNGSEIQLADSANKIKRWVTSADKKYSFQSGKVLTLLFNTPGDLSGTTGHPDTLQSTSPTNAAMLYFGVQPNESNAAIKDIYSRNFVLYDTTGGTNLLGDSNVTFTTVYYSGAHGYYNTPAVPTLVSVSPATGSASGGNNDTLTGTKLFAPCSLKVAGTWYAVNVIDSTKVWFLRAAMGSDVTISDTIKNADGRIAFLTNDYTYTIITSITSIKHPMGRIGYVDTVFGTGFYNGGNATVHNVAATLVRQINDTIIFITPTTTAGTWKFVYHNPYSSSDSINYRVLIPTITGASP
jgi:hypothetical protein